MLIRAPIDLGAVIRDHRNRHGWDQQTLASKIGVSRQWVVEVEKGKARAQVGLVLRALDAVGVALSIAGVAAVDVSGSDIDQIVDQARRLD